MDDSTMVAEQFDNAAQQKETVTLGMWTFLATEVLFFGGLFLSYVIYRVLYPDAFATAGRRTLLGYGTINTAILLTSSLTMALAVQAARTDKSRTLTRLLAATVILGTSFLVLKGFEYRDDLNEQLLPGAHFRADLPPAARIFWFLYWVMTGLHGLHVVVGIVVLAGLTWQSRRGKYSSRYHNPVELSGLYWHFVDLVWIYLYPLLYLIDRSL